MRTLHLLTGWQKCGAKRMKGFLLQRSDGHLGHRRLLYMAAALCIGIWSLNSCQSTVDPGDFTAEEIALIRMYSYSEQGESSKDRQTRNEGKAGEVPVMKSSGEVDSISNVPAGTMRVLTIEDSRDNAILRDTSRNLSAKALMSDEYDQLTKLMVATVTHPSQDGVGIAGPQVGLNRRVVAVQRFDKEGEPFEVYPNISIVWASDSLASGPEGCLSVPDRREDVMRSREIVIEYADMEAVRATGKNHSGARMEACRKNKMESCSKSVHITGQDYPETCRDTVRGFTAVIFQHEIDHLDGILYIDRL